MIATGTPAGVGIGRKPIRDHLLQVGDTVRVEIEGIGELVNTVVEEPEGFVAWCRDQWADARRRHACAVSPPAVR